MPRGSTQSKTKRKAAAPKKAAPKKVASKAKPSVKKLRKKIVRQITVNTKSLINIKTYEKTLRKLPKKMRPYKLLARIDRPIGIWLLFLPGAWAIMLSAGGLFSMNFHDWKLLALFGLGAIVMRSAGCVINDLWDRDLDTQVARTKKRPLAAGTLTPFQALGFLAGLLLVGFLILMKMNITTILLGILSLPLIVAYPLMKRFTWWPQAFLGLTFNFGALMGWSAVTGIVESSALFLYIAGILWTLGYDTIYAHQDRADDMLAGIKSTALKLGEDSKRWVQGFYIGAFVFLILAIIASASDWYLILLLIPAMHYTYGMLDKWHPQKPRITLRAFQANRNVGLLILAAFALSGF